MTNSLNIKRINHFIFVNVFIYTDISIGATHIFACMSVKFQKNFVTNSEFV